MKKPAPSRETYQKVIDRLIAMTAGAYWAKEHRQYTTITIDYDNGKIMVKAPWNKCNDPLLGKDLSAHTRDYNRRFPGEEKISLKTSNAVEETQQQTRSWTNSNNQTIVEKYDVKHITEVTITVKIAPPKDEDVIGVLQLFLVRGINEALASREIEAARIGDRIRITSNDSFDGWIPHNDGRLELVLKCGYNGTNVDFLNITLGHIDNVPPEIFLARIIKALQIALNINSYVTERVVSECPVPSTLEASTTT